MSFSDVLEIVKTLQTPIVAFMAWILFRIKTNDLPHLQDSQNEINERLAHLEGRLDEEDNIRLSHRRRGPHNE